KPDRLPLISCKVCFLLSPQFTEGDRAETMAQTLASGNPFSSATCLHHAFASLYQDVSGCRIARYSLVRFLPFIFDKIIRIICFAATATRPTTGRQTVPV